MSLTKEQTDAFSSVVDMLLLMMPKKYPSIRSMMDVPKDELKRDLGAAADPVRDRRYK